MFRHLWIPIVFLLVACNDSRAGEDMDVIPVDATPDVATDTAADTAPTPVDATPDIAPDTPPDIAVDTAPDTAEDTAPDVAPDAPPVETFAELTCALEEMSSPGSSSLSVPLFSVVVCRVAFDGGPPIVDYFWSVTTENGVAVDFSPPDSSQAIRFTVAEFSQHTVEVTLIDDRGNPTEPLTATVNVISDAPGLEVCVSWETVTQDEELVESDLDLHLLHSNGCWGDRGWDYHRGTSNAWGDPTSRDDDPDGGVDATTSPGTECIRLETMEAGVDYQVGVLFYRDHGNGPVNARVTWMFDGEEQLQLEQTLAHTERGVGEFWVVGGTDDTGEVAVTDQVFDRAPTCD